VRTRVTTPSTFKKQGLLSTGDIAERLGVHRTTVWHWMKSGMLKSTRVTPRFRGVSEADLKAFQSNFIPDAVVSPKKKPPSKKKKVAKKAT
jgi:excisionase family DNA binding protein